MSDSRSGRSALVTGGAGFIGSHVVEGLLAAGWKVRALDDFSSGRAENLAEVIEGIELIRGDIRDESALERALDGIEVVFHEAAVPSVPVSVEEPLRTHSVNVEATLKLLEFSRHANVRRVVYAASSAAYGNTPGVPKVETMKPSLASPYGLQKYAGEVYCQIYTEIYGLETASLRYFNVYGPRQDPKSQYAAVIPAFVVACMNDEPPRVYGDGNQTRDFVAVADVVRANLMAADSPKAVGRVCNIATGRGTSLNELLENIRELTGAHVEVRYEPERDGDVRESVASVELARELLGYQPSVDLREGLRRTIDSFRGKGETQ